MPNSSAAHVKSPDAKPASRSDADDDLKTLAIAEVEKRLGTQALATCIALFGFGLVTPLAWQWVLLVWGCALAWFLLNDRIKLLACSILDRFNIGEATVAAAPRPRLSAPPVSRAEDGKADAKAGEAETKPTEAAQPPLKAAE